MLETHDFMFKKIQPLRLTDPTKVKISQLYSALWSAKVFIRDLPECEVYVSSNRLWKTVELVWQGQDYRIGIEVKERVEDSGKSLFSED